MLLFALIQDENFEKKVSNFTAVIVQTYKLDMKNRSVGLTHESLRLMSEVKRGDRYVVVLNHTTVESKQSKNF